MEIMMKVAALMPDPMSRMPILILKDIQSDLILPIWIGLYEANAIAISLEGGVTPRPMTHDLLKNFLDQVNIKVDKIVINDVRDNTYYAVIYCRQHDLSYLIDARPSDAIALALRTNSPIYVDEEVIKMTKSPELGQNPEDSERLRKLLESLKPEDLGKYKM
ncbi:MAG: bifunctional nuclease family protein [Acidobacteriota bacterium]|nr:bifunctional nuclease family protein [Acidobacteriota bacterium]